MNLGIETLIANIGVGFEYVIVLVAVFGGLVFFAKDFRIGILMTMIIHTGIFIWFVKAEYNYAPPLIILMIAVVLLSLSLYSSSQSAASMRGGLV